MANLADVARRFRCLSLLVGSMILGSGPLAAADAPFVLYPSFRVETDIFEGDAASPQSQHLILFDSGVVYDLPVGNGSIITVFDIPRNRVILVHRTTRVRTSISSDLLIQMTAQVRAEAAVNGKAMDSLGLNAKVISGVTPESYVVEFDGNRYEASTQSVSDPAIAAEFAAFTAWAARLNIARHVGPPPFARIALADHLAALERMPKQVKLDVRRSFKTRTFRSENLVVERLSDPDRKKISDVGGMIASFTEVDFSEFPTD